MTRAANRLIPLSLLVVIAAVLGGIGLLRLLSIKDADWILKFSVIVFISSILFALVLSGFDKIKRFIPYLLVLSISQTGFLFTLKQGHHTSANELVTFLLLFLFFARKLITQDTPREKIYISVPLYIFLLLSIVGIANAYWVSGIPGMNIFTEVKSYTLYLFYLLLIPECITNEKELRRLVIMMVIVSTLPLFLATYTGMENTIFIIERLNLEGWGALNIFIGYIVPLFFVVCGLLIDRKAVFLKPFLVIYIAAVLYTSLLSQTRTGWIALFAGIVLFTLLIRRKLPYVITIGLLAILIMSTPMSYKVQNIVQHRIVERTIQPDHSIFDRLAMWKNALATAKAYPLTGTGWGGWPIINEDGSVRGFLGSLLPRWHNSYLEILSQLGFPGLFAFLFLWWKILKQEGMRIFRMSASNHQSLSVGIYTAVIVCLIYALGEQQFFRIETASHSYLLAGLLIANGRLISDKEKAGLPAKNTHLE